MSINIIKLIRKDFYTLWIENRLGLIFLLFSGAISAFSAPTTGFIWLVFMFLNISAITMSLFNLDEKYRPDIFLTSLPVSRKEIVISRYGLVMVIFIIYAVTTYLLDIFDVIHPGKTITWYIPAGYYISLFVALAFLTSVSFPLYFWLGYKKGKGVEIFFIFLLVLGYGPVHRSKEFREAIYTSNIFSFDLSIYLMLTGIAVLLIFMSVPLTMFLYSRKEL